MIKKFYLENDFYFLFILKSCDGFLYFKEKYSYFYVYIFIQTYIFLLILNAFNFDIVELRK